MPVKRWGSATFDYALRDDDLALMEHLLHLGWPLDTQQTDYWGQANSLAAYQWIIQAGILAYPDSKYPFDCPIYLLLYNLAARLEQCNKTESNRYLEWIERDKTKLQLLLEYCPELP